jgi:hypothetical protein
MVRQLSRLPAFIVSVLIVAACGMAFPNPTSMVGSGHVISEGRAVDGFSSVEVDGPLAVHITAGVPGSATVTADDNLVPVISTTVTGGRLVIRLPSNTTISATSPMTVAVGVPQLTALTGQAASRTTFDRLASADFALTLDAASQVSGSGRVDHLVLTSSAASIARLTDVEVRQADVTLHAASIVEFTAVDAVRGEAHEASILHVHGNPSVLSVDTSEMSRVVTDR